MSIVGIIVSAFIWHINRNIFGNEIRACIPLSATTFLLIYVPFEIYFSIRTIWYDRWENLNSDKIKITKISIPIDENLDNGSIIAHIVKSREIRGINSKNTLIIVSHGYSDTKETLQYLYFPLALQGYTILAYDGRGSGESEKLGKRNQLLKRIKDYRSIINWVQNEEGLNGLDICSVGFSIGAIIAISAGFTNERIKKIIAISCISHYKQNITKCNPIIKLGYMIRGIPLSPSEKQNQQLSPYLIFERNKKRLSKRDFERLAHRIFLIHSKNDRVIKFINFQQNKSILELSPENQLVFKRGGHTMKKNEPALMGGILRFLEN